MRSVWNWRLMMKHGIKLGIKKLSNSTSFKIETYITTNVREQSVCECTNALLSPPLCPFSPPGCNLKLYTRVTALSRHRLCRWSLYLLRSFIKVWGNQRRGDAPQRFCPSVWSSADLSDLLEERVSYSSSGFIDRGLLNVITCLRSMGRWGGGAEAHQLKIRAEVAEWRRPQHNTVGQSIAEGLRGNSSRLRSWWWSVMQQSDLFLERFYPF